MPDERQWADYTGHAFDTVCRLMVMQKVARDLKMFFQTEPELPPRLQTLLQKLEEQQEQN